MDTPLELGSEQRGELVPTGSFLRTAEPALFILGFSRSWSVLRTVLLLHARPNATGRADPGTDSLRLSRPQPAEGLRPLVDPARGILALVSTGAGTPTSRHIE